MLRVPLPQNPVLVVVSVLLGTLVFVGLGVAMTGWVPNAGVAPVMCIPFLLISMFCSGVFTPIEELPSWLQQIARVLPLTPVLNGVRTGWFGQDFSTVGVDIPATVGFTAGFAAMGFGLVILLAWLVGAYGPFRDNFRREPRHS